MRKKSAFGFSLIRTLTIVKNLVKSKSFNLKGFSLIELLVVISIICILSVVGIASYVNFSRSQTVTQTARKIVQDMRLAQSLANNGQKPEAGVCSPSCQTLDGYTFSLNYSSKSYTISANCLPVVPCNAIKSETLASNFSFIGLTAVKFKVLRRGVEFTGVGKTLKVTAFTTISKKIILDDGGSILIEGETPTP